jgi:hypothetical protein
MYVNKWRLELWADALNTQHELLMTVKPRASEDAPTDIEISRIVDAHYNLLPILKLALQNIGEE